MQDGATPDRRTATDRLRSAGELADERRHQPYLDFVTALFAGKVPVVVFGDDTVETLVEYATMSPYDSDERGGVEKIAYWTREWCEKEGMDLTSHDGMYGIEAATQAPAPKADESPSP